MVNVTARTCRNCGGEYYSSDRRQLVCDRICRDHWQRTTATVKRGGSPVECRRVPGSPTFEIHCVQCGVWFHSGAAQARTCSDACRRDRERNRRIKRAYGIELADFERLWLEQGGKCAICLTDLRPGVTGAHIDHCHDTAEVRGLLCAHCNHGLGKFGEDVERLQRAIEYLRR